MSNGKGSSRRPGENKQAFDAGWEAWQKAKDTTIKAAAAAKRDETRKGEKK